MVDSHVIEACQSSKWIIGVVTLFAYWHRANCVGSRRATSTSYTQISSYSSSGLDPVIGRMRPGANKTNREANETQQSNGNLLGMNWHHLGRLVLTWEVGTSSSLCAAARCGGKYSKIPDF